MHIIIPGKIVFMSDIPPHELENRPVESFRRVIYRGIPTTYLISSYGRVISLNYGGWGRTKENKTRIRSNGYREAQISICGKMYYVLVHRLVAMAFIPNPDNKSEVNHINGNKRDNHIWNLEWVTHSENVQHAYRTNLHPVKRGEEVPTSKNKTPAIIKVCEMLSRGESYKSIANATGVSADMVKAIHVRRTWRCVSNNYIFPVHVSK